ncbi:glycine-rich protein [Pontibacter pudoricolor]|uniref:glycine-rich protein n=1 Tax=Pontibacter pudoricolor TaxID=2694930 RepID=UPI0013920F10|nr:glycine-rich protein [Pontibacter pudoricolor]
MLLLILLPFTLTVSSANAQGLQMTCPADINANTASSCNAKVNFTDPVPTIKDEFNYTGGVQTYTVPAGVTSLKVDVIGASGGYAYPKVSHIPGNGGRLQANIAVNPGDVLYLYVGGKGSDGESTVMSPGGYNGGGLGQNAMSSYSGGGGGGASDIRLNGTSLSNRIIVAGGGGGAAYNFQAGDDGGNGGELTGADGKTGDAAGASGGKGGTQTAGGAGGFWYEYYQGTPGTLGTGGNGAPSTSGGGAGGGYYGGGGGAWTGAGGGSSFSFSGATDVIHTQGDRIGNGQIIVSNPTNTVTLTQTAGLPSGSSFPVGTTVNTFKATDNLGNSVTCSFNVIVTDTEKPTIAAAADITKNVGLNTGTGTKTVTLPNNNAFAGSYPAIINFQDPLPAGAVITGYSVSYTVYSPYSAAVSPSISGSGIGDFNPNQETKTLHVSFDKTIPNYVYGGTNNLTIYSWWNGIYFRGGTITLHYATVNPNVCEASVTVPKPLVTDNCNGTTLVNSFNGTSDASGVYPVGTTDVIWTATDANGNVTTHTQKVTVVDNVKPTITAPATVTVSNDAGKTTASGVTLGTPVTADNCELGTTTNDAPGTFPIGNTTVTWTVTDAVGNSATATQIVTVEDKEGPVPTIATLPTITGECSATVTAPTASDNVSGTITGTTTDPVTYTAQGTYTINWTYTDGAGNKTTQEQTVRVKDIRKPGEPSFAAPATIASEVYEAAHYNLAYSLDLPNYANWDDQSQIPYTINNAAALQGKTITRIAYAMELDNKWVWVSMDAFSQDVSKLGIPTGVDGFQQKVSNMNVVASSNSGLTNATGIATGNIEIWSQCYSVTNSLGLQGANNNIYDFDDIRDGENCYGSFQVHNFGTGETLLAFNRWSDAAGEILDMGIGSRPSEHTDWTFASNAVDYTTKKLHVFVQTEDVVFAKDATVYLDATGNASITVADVNAGVTDNCGIATVEVSPSTFTDANLGKNTVVLTATDVNGNVGTATAIVTVIDNLAPVVITQDLTIQLDVNGTATITADQVNNNTTDNGGIASMTLSRTSFDCNNLGANTVTLTVTDLSGNSETATATVTIVDLIKPTITAPVAVTVNTDAGKNTASEVALGTAVTADNCSVASITNDAPVTFPVGNTTVTWTVTDVAGNSATATQLVTVTDKEAPVPTIATLPTITGQCSATVTAPTATDNVSGTLTGTTPDPLEYTEQGTYTITWTYEDGAGNSFTQPQQVVVKDDTKPVVLTQNITVSLDATGNATITTVQIDNGSSDNCGIASYKLDKAEFGCAHLGENTVTLTVTDVNGNVAKKEAIVTIVDEIAPTALARNITVELDANGSVTLTAAQVNDNSTDNCGVATLTLDKDTFGCSNLGENTVNLTVTDKAGNTAIAAATVTIVDHIAPTITAPADVVVDVDAGKTTASNVDLGTPVTADNCDAAAIDVTNDAPTHYPAGTTTVTWTATDASGNKTTATQTVTVRQDIASVATLATITVPIRTAFASVPLPATVAVTYTNGEQEAIGVTWAAGTYNGLVAGTYVLSGQLIAAPNTTNQSSKTATITVVVEPNKVPTALAFSATTFAPNVQADDVIGTLTTTDPDDTQFVYTLVAGSGDSDNSLFEISGDKVYLKSNNGLSGKTTFSFRVRSTDPYQNTIEKAFTLTKGNYGVAVDKLKIVNAFSPNGDGINDSWSIPELRFYNQVEVEVFDRSGVRLFHTTDPEMAWDGRSANGQVLQGAFFYIVQVRDINLVKKGVVTILKK